LATESCLAGELGKFLAFSWISADLQNPIYIRKRKFLFFIFEQEVTTEQL
jgi:hypothetical protein